MVWEEREGGVGGEGRWCGRRGKVVLEEREGGWEEEREGGGREGRVINPSLPLYLHDSPYLHLYFLLL